jgi:hypothetical protein
MAACAFSSPGIAATSAGRLPAIWSALAMRWPALTWPTEKISWTLPRSGVQPWVAPRSCTLGRLLCAADISATAPGLDLAARLAPDVPVRDLMRYRTDPWRSLVDCSAAATTLGWRPRYRWSQHGHIGAKTG